MDIRKVIVSSQLWCIDKKTHIKKFIDNTGACLNKQDFIDLLTYRNVHEPEKAVDRILNEYSEYNEEYVDKHIAWSLRSRKEITGVNFEIEYIDTYNYSDEILDQFEYELFY